MCVSIYILYLTFKEENGYLYRKPTYKKHRGRRIFIQNSNIQEAKKKKNIQKTNIQEAKKKKKKNIYSEFQHARS